GGGGLGRGGAGPGTAPGGPAGRGARSKSTSSATPAPSQYSTRLQSTTIGAFGCFRSTSCAPPQSGPTEYASSRPESAIVAGPPLPAWRASAAATVRAVVLDQ